MQKDITLRLLPSEAADSSAVNKAIAVVTGFSAKQVNGHIITKQSIDARGRQPWIQLHVKAFINEPVQSPPYIDFHFPDVFQAEKKVIIVGAGPAGLFAALHFISCDIRPVLLERGKDVRARRRDLAAMNKEGLVNPESNYCFGEGGAGTYSDGKLYTRSSKRGDINRVLQLLVHFGADEKILYQSHPHIGTNKLPQIITAMRHKILACGGEFLFEKKVTDFIIRNNEVQKVLTADGDVFTGDAFILATGHSARDIFSLLHEKKIDIYFKPFALGVRVEHPQSLIDSIQYHCDARGEHLPPASYSLVQQVNNQGVFSFCMCPGGIIAPAATNHGEIVVNGWSPSKRNNPYANSGMVVTVNEKDVQPYIKYGALAGLHFQQKVEQMAFTAGGGKLVAPAQRLEDFVKGRPSTTLPDCSYLPGIHAVKLNDVLPSFIHTSLQGAFKAFGAKMKGYLTNEAVVVATESRTSSPVRIPRDEKKLHHPQIQNLFPCGEGAGYAGGIVSAAMDGEKVAAMISAQLQNR